MTGGVLGPAVARARRLTVRAVVTSGLPSALDRRILRTAFDAAPRDPRRRLVLPPPGAGNVGDQALVEAVLENLAGPIALVVGNTGDVQLPPLVRSRVEVLAAPDLVYGSGAAHRAAVADFGRVLATASELLVLGADVMDGRYALPASVRRATIAAAAAAAGVGTRVVGFSWSADARLAARRAMTVAGNSGVRLLARDPVSAVRARSAGLRVTEAADVVFAAHTVDGSAADELLHGISAPVALVNVSGLLAQRFDQIPDYVAVVDALRARGLHVLLLPHVRRPTGDDVAACAAVARRVGTDRVSSVPALLPPAQVRGLAARTAVTVTGRMHLAVMSLMNGVPALTLASQGKVEGLMQLVGAPELCLPARPGFAAGAVEVIDRSLPADSAVRAAIRAALPTVTELARRNFDGLALTVPAPADA